MENNTEDICEKVDIIFLFAPILVIPSFGIIILFIWFFDENLLVPFWYLVLIFLMVLLWSWVNRLSDNLRKAANDVGELEHIIRLDEREELNNIEELFAKIELANASISSLKSSIVLNLIDRKIWGRIQKLLYDLDSRLKILFNDLKEDMKFHIESQKDLLLRGNHNVSQVLQDMKDRENQEILELQKARLDRQIAQFDVLQKLLVKA